MMFRDDNVSELRRLLAVAHDRIRELEEREPEIVEVERIKVVEVPGPERIVEKIRIVEKDGPERIIYIDNPELIDAIRSLQEQVCQCTSV